MRWVGPALLALACSPLPELPVEQCGNGVIEANESCDLFIPRSLRDRPLRCGAANEGALACRLVCDPTQNGADCPLGWQCGQDQICRHADWSLAARVSETPLRASTIGVADFDGDGWLDVHGGDGDTLEVVYGDGAFSFVAGPTQRTALRRGPAAAGDLNGDGRADLVVPIISGLDVLYGQAARVLAPQLYTRPVLGEEPIDLRTLLPEVGPPCFGSRPLFVAVGAGEQGGTVAFVAFPDDLNEPDVFLFEQPFQSLIELTGAIPLRDLDGDRRSEILVALPGATRALVPSVQLLNPNQPSCRDARYRLGEPSVIPLGPARVNGPAQFADIDGDGEVDAYVATDDGPRIAFGPRPNVGLEWSAARDLRQLSSLGCQAPLPPETRGLLAAAPLDEQAGADLVLSDGIYLSRQGRRAAGGFEGQACLAYPSPSPWSEATTGDYDGDGLLDVAALEPKNNVVSVLLNAGGERFNDFTFTVSGRIRFLRTGDFDGDGTDDLVFVEEDAVGSILQVIYGGPALGISRPVDMGQLAAIRSVEPGFLGFGSVIETDARTDLALGVSSSKNPSLVDALALVQGMASRRMFAPLFTQTQDQSRLDPAAVAIGAFAGEDRRTDLAFVGSGGENGGRVYGLFQAVDGSFRPDDLRVDQATGLCGTDPAEGNRGCLVSTAGRLDPNAAGGSLISVEGDVDCADPETPQICLYTPLSPEGGRTCAFPSRVQRGADSLVPQAVRPLQLADVDRDQDLDLILPFAGRGNAESPGGVAVILRDPLGSCGYSVARAVTVPVGQVVRAAAALNADADPQLEVALLIDRSVFLSDGWPDAPSLSEAPIFSQAGQQPVSLLAIDLDRDGVEELLLGSAEGLTVWQAGREVIPRLRDELDGGQAP